MTIDIVRGELERLFSLDEMMALSQDLLGFSPSEIGGAASKASFARALTDRCLEADAIEALLDAVLASRTEVDPRIRELGQKGLTLPEEIKAGETFGPFTITKKLGEGPRGFVYAATKDGVDRTLKVYRREATRDARAAHRFVTRVRLAAGVRHEGLPADLTVGIEGGRVWTAYAPIDGQPLAVRIGRTGPLHINEARNILRGVLEALSALHEKHLVHGAIKLENVIISRGEGGATRPILVDVGGDLLLGGPWSSAALVKTASPELLRGKTGDAASDLYSFGALMFEVLTGKPAFPGDSAVDVAIAQLTKEAPVPSATAPRGWVGKELDDLAQKLLQKSEQARPKNVAAVLETLEPAAKPADGEAKKGLSDAELDERVDTLLADPSDGQAALAVESTIELGADPNKVADAFTIAADSIEEGDDEISKLKNREFKKSLLFRAARIYESALKDKEKAESVYTSLLELDPEDDITFTALEEIRKQLGKHEELVEMLLERSESATRPPRARPRPQRDRAPLRARPRRQGAGGLRLRQGARAGHAERRVRHRPRARRRERHEALDRGAARAEHRVDQRGHAARGQDRALHAPRPLVLGEGGAARPQAALLPGGALGRSVHDGALEGTAQVYRRAQQWQELGQVLIARADRAPTPAQARDIRAEAADILETRLNEAAHARDLFEQIFAEDPGHQKATDALARIYQKMEDHAGFAKILERRAEALRGEAKVETICKLAELYEDQLNNLPEATRRYEAALELDAQALTALRGLDRIYNRTGKYKELLQNLERQVAISATPRQKIKLYERIAGIQDEEFLDHLKAAEAYEAILQIDSAHEGALTALVRHYRALDRWEDCVSLYEKNLRIATEDKRRVELYLAMGRVLVEQVGSPERARHAFEKVLEIDPDHGGALESLASVRAATGDAMAALSAIESLAVKATSPESKADLWIRAAKMLEEKGDRDGAIERYKKALDAQKGNLVASAALRAAYLGRGDATSAVELIGREIESAEGNLAKARLYGDMAELLREKLKDNDRAKEAATKAVDLDPTSLLGLMITGDIAFEAGRFIEASKSYESIANPRRRPPQGPRDRGPHAVRRRPQQERRSREGRGRRQDAAGPRARRSGAIRRAARANLDTGKSRESAALYEDLVQRFGDQLETEEKAETMLRFGEARLKAGDPDGAIAPLNEASDLAPDSPEPILLLCKVYEAKKDF